MNKLISRLNPKTTNFESAGAGSGVGNITAADVSIGLSYAKLDPISSELIRFKCLNDATPARIAVVAQQLALQFMKRFITTDLSIDVLRSCCQTALIEFCMVPFTYKPSGRNRALFLGVTESYYRRHNLKYWVDIILSEVQELHQIADQQFSRQMATLKPSII